MSKTSPEECEGSAPAVLYRTDCQSWFYISPYLKYFYYGSATLMHTQVTSPWLVVKQHDCAHRTEITVQRYYGFEGQDVRLGLPNISDMLGWD